MKRLKNIKHENFAREYVTNNGNASQAYQTVYPASEKVSAIKSGSRLLTKDDVKTRVSELLQQKTGSRVSVLLEDLIDLKTANKEIIADKIKHEVRDNPTRTTAILTLLRLHGLLAANSTTVDNRAVTFNVQPPDIKSLDGILTRLERITDRDDRISGRVKN